MGIQEGDCVLVNLAPFIGSSHRSKVHIPCRVLAAGATYVEVRANHPFREVCLRVSTAWIEGKLESSQESARNRGRTSSTAEVHRAAVGLVG